MQFYRFAAKMNKKKKWIWSNGTSRNWNSFEIFPSSTTVWHQNWNKCILNSNGAAAAATAAVAVDLIRFSKQTRNAFKLFIIESNTTHNLFGYEARRECVIFNASTAHHTIEMDFSSRHSRNDTNSAFAFVWMPSRTLARFKFVFKCSEPYGWFN